MTSHGFTSPGPWPGVRVTSDATPLRRRPAAKPRPSLRESLRRRPAAKPRPSLRESLRRRPAAQRPSLRESLRRRPAAQRPSLRESLRRRPAAQRPLRPILGDIDADLFDAVMKGFAAHAK
ncbi:MAG: hypothetical protein RIR53_1480, partial [Bacteroidota bacterium]